MSPMHATLRASASRNSNSILFYHSKEPLYHYTILFYNTSSIPNFYFPILLIKIIYPKTQIKKKNPNHHLLPPSWHHHKQPSTHHRSQTHQSINNHSTNQTHQPNKPISTDQKNHGDLNSLISRKATLSTDDAIEEEVIDTKWFFLVSMTH